MLLTPRNGVNLLPDFESPSSTIRYVPEGVSAAVSHVIDVSLTVFKNILSSTVTPTPSQSHPGQSSIPQPLLARSVPVVAARGMRDGRLVSSWISRGI